ncbi:MAG: 16S rRNA (guanine(527)-N(7))-methyltransferase RsmG [Bacteroidetes bacterium]|nr:16S rRNA (guanine(527)-N(7))-methyltransferase RsmG [Bacteroidota bacterium]
MAFCDGAQLLLTYYPNLAVKQVATFHRLGELLRTWNEQINVISRKDIDFLYERHILHALSISRTTKFIKGTSFLDVGTGGGIPGLPLAIVLPDCNFHLIDARGKKIKVVKDIINQLGLKNVQADHMRVENVKDQYNFILGRAVTNLNDFFGLVRSRVKKGGKNDIPNGIIYLKGGEFANEIDELGDVEVREWELKDIYPQEYYETKKIIAIRV